MFISFLYFFISSKYVFHVDAERLIVIMRECKEISASMVKNVWHDTSLVGEKMQIFVGYGQLNYYL